MLNEEVNGRERPFTLCFGQGGSTGTLPSLASSPPAVDSSGPKLSDQDPVSLQEKRPKCIVSVQPWSQFLTSRSGAQHLQLKSGLRGEPLHGGRSAELPLVMRSCEAGWFLPVPILHPILFLSSYWISESLCLSVCLCLSYVRSYCFLSIPFVARSLPEPGA